MKRQYLTALIIFVLIFALMPTVQAQSPQQTLNMYISDLQNNPNDYALREKIIKHVRGMKQKPAIPEEVQKYMDRGIAAIESAKTAEDFQDAAAEFMKAVTAAPWLGNGYRNLAIAQDKAGQYDAALKNLQLYLLTRPSSSDEAWAKTLMNKVEYRKEKAAEKAAKESSPQAVAEREKNRDQDLIKRLNGARYVGQSTWTKSLIYDNEVVIRGTTLVWRQCLKWEAPDVVNEPDDYKVGEWYEKGQLQIVGREARHQLFVPNGPVSEIFTISADGKSITYKQLADGGSTSTFYRQ